MVSNEIHCVHACHTPWSIAGGVISAIGLLIWCFVLGDHKGCSVVEVQDKAVFKANPVLALLTLLPIVILVVGNVWIPTLEIGVAQAMVLGSVVMFVAAMLIQRTNPQEYTRQFFNGLGKAYGDVMGIIIAAGVFVAGLETTGLIASLVELLKTSNEIARWGGSIGPWFLAAISGSADAATMAFNEAVTPYAKEFGMETHTLGALAYLCGKFGRVMSPIAGGMIIACGIAGANPIDAAKRTAIPMLFATFFMALFMV